MPETWPAAITEQLPLIHIKHTPSSPAATTPAFQSTSSRLVTMRDAELMGAFDLQEPNNSGCKGDPAPDRPAKALEGAIKAAQEEQAGSKPLSWDQLVREGVLLGM